MIVKQKQLFNDYRQFIEKAMLQLDLSYQKVQNPPPALTTEEAFEILTSRFGRVADLYTQKILGFLFKLLQLPDLNFIDKCAYLEKLNLIQNVKELYKIRELRNTIAHEYALETLNDLHQQVFEYTPVLIAIIKATLDYVDVYINKLEA